MKRSFYPKLAWESIRKNKRIYRPYLFAGSLMVMMFYILMSMTESPTLKNMHGGSFLMTVLPLGYVVIWIFSVLFLFYTNSFLIKQRYREFGLYNILGMDKRNISRLMLWETLFTAAIAIAVGLACGVAFSKAAELILLNILNEEISFEFHIGVNSLRVTALLYVCIYLLLLLYSLVKVYRSKPVELMRSSHTGEQRLKCNWFFGLLGLALLIGAYYMAVTIKEPLSALIDFFVAVIMVIVGTYLLFISGSVALCKLLQRNKRYYYKSEHFVSVSSMAYRMKRNGAGLASICILLTMVLVMLSSTTGLYLGEEGSLNQRYPNGVNITYTFETLDGIGDENLNRQREVIRQYAPSDAELSGTRYAVAAGQFTDDGIILEKNHIGNVDYDKVGYLYILSVEDYNDRMGTAASLSDKECLLYSDRLNTNWDSFTVEYGNTYRVKERLTEFKRSGEANAMITPDVYLVVADVRSFLAPLTDLKNSFDLSMVEYKWLLGFDCDTAEEEIATKDALFGALLRSAGDDRPWKTLSLESREEERFAFYALYGSFFFLGIMLSVVFLMAAVLIIYYKQISEGYEDQGRFEIMRKVGMTKRDIRRSINSQMLTVFFLPLGMAGLHLVFAFPFLSKILTMFIFDDWLLSALVTIVCFLIFGVFYAIVYQITSGSYYAIVSGKKELFCE